MVDATRSGCRDFLPSPIKRNHVNLPAIMKPSRFARSIVRILDNLRCKTLTKALRRQPKETSPFLLLPAELRNIVYRLLLRTDQELGSIIYGPGIRRFTTSVTNILLLKRQIHDEAASILYGQNVFLYILRAISSKPFGYVDHPAHYMRYISFVTIDVKVLNSTDLDEEERTRHISLLRRSAERMRELLSAVNTVRKVTLSIDFTSRDENEAHEQEDLMLEIFGKVKGVRKVEILGNAPTQYKQHLKEVMERRSLTCKRQP